MKLTHLLFKNKYPSRLQPKSFKLKVSIAEIIIRYELSDFEYLEKLINTIKNRFLQLQKTNEHQRDFAFIKLVFCMIKYQGAKKYKVAENRMKSFVDQYENEKANDVINYINWLMKKMNTIN